MLECTELRLWGICTVLGNLRGSTDLYHAVPVAINCTGTDLGSCRLWTKLDRHMNVQVCAFAGLCIRPVWPDLYECTTGQQHACAGFEPGLQGWHQGTSASKCLRPVPPTKSAQLCTGHTLEIVSTVREMPKSASTTFPSSSSSRLAGLQGRQWPGVHQRWWGLYAVACIAGAGDSIYLHPTEQARLPEP